MPPLVLNSPRLFPEPQTLIRTLSRIVGGSGRSRILSFPFLGVCYRRRKKTAPHFTQKSHRPCQSVFHLRCVACSPTNNVRRAITTNMHRIRPHCGDAPAFLPRFCSKQPRFSKYLCRNTLQLLALTPCSPILRQRRALSKPLHAKHIVRSRSRQFLSRSRFTQGSKIKWPSSSSKNRIWVAKRWGPSVLCSSCEARARRAKRSERCLPRAFPPVCPSPQRYLLCAASATICPMASSFFFSLLHELSVRPGYTVRFSLLLLQKDFYS